MNALGLWDRLGTAVACIAALLVLILPVWCIFKRGRTMNKKLWMAGYLLLLLWIARFFVGYFGGIYLKTGEEGLSLLEALGNSLIHALQTFSMDEDYTEYTLTGKSLLEAVGLSWWAPVYGAVISVMNICAPVLGGAMLLDILTNMFPQLRLYFIPRRHKFVFSELNEASVCLAEDICAHKNYRSLLKMGRFEGRPAIVFTDAYLADESETSSELFDRARAIGAICLRKDLLHLSFRRSKSVHYFLIDADGDGNISALSQLLRGERTGRPLWPGRSGGQATSKGEQVRTNMFVFVKSDIESSLVKKICAKDPEHADQVLIRPIRDYRNAAFNLFYDVPLFLPLLSKDRERKQDLTVTIFGGGQVAEDVFKAAFWFGQIYGVQLHMNVVSYQVERLGRVLRQDCRELLESCQADASLLEVYPLDPGREKAPPYSTEPQLIECQDASSLPDLPEDILRETDYYVVALGSDQKNLQVADQLRNSLMHQMLEQGDGDRHPVIAAAVFSRALGRAAEDLSPADCCPYMVSFADMQSRYTCKNVFMKDLAADALSSAEMYDKKQESKDRDDEYSYLSSMARTLHAPYKLFGLGVVEEVRLRGNGDRPSYRFRQIPPLTQAQLDELAWNEHRRWNAFMRSQGFSCPSKAQLDRYAYQGDLKHKYIDAKLHPCLVESAVTPTPLPEDPALSDAQYDGLDFVAMYLYDLQLQKGDVNVADVYRAMDTERMRALRSEHRALAAEKEACSKADEEKAGKIARQMKELETQVCDYLAGEAGISRQVLIPFVGLLIRGVPGADFKQWDYPAHDEHLSGWLKLSVASEEPVSVGTGT